MSGLKEYITVLVAGTLLAAVFNMLLPESGIKKYASYFLGLILMTVMIMPVQRLLRGGISFPYLETQAAVGAEEIYVTMLEEEFCKKTEQLIHEKSGGAVRAEVYATISDKTVVERVVLYGEPDSGTMFYITNELGVSRSCVEIR